MANLTQRQEKFVRALIAGKSQRQAYKEAYNAANMKDKTIDERASVLFKNDKIKTRYDELLEEHKKKALYTRENAVNEDLEIIQNMVEEIKNDQFFDENEDVQFDRNIAVYVDKSDTKKLGKEHPEFLYAVREIKRKMKSDEHLNSYAYDLNGKKLDMHIKENWDKVVVNDY